MNVHVYTLAQFKQNHGCSRHRVHRGGEREREREREREKEREQERERDVITLLHFMRSWKGGSMPAQSGSAPIQPIKARAGHGCQTVDPLRGAPKTLNPKP